MSCQLLYLHYTSQLFKLSIILDSYEHFQNLNSVCWLVSKEMLEKNKKFPALLVEDSRKCATLIVLKV